MVPLPQSCAQPYPPRAGARAHAGGGAEYTRAAAGRAAAGRAAAGRAAAGRLRKRKLDTRRRDARAGGGARGWAISPSILPQVPLPPSLLLHFS